MIKLTRCKVTSEDSIVADFQDAVVISSGNNPNSTIVLSTLVETPSGNHKGARVDRLLHASLKGKGKEWTATGVSEQMIEQAGIPRDEAIVTYRIETLGPCENCQ